MLAWVSDISVRSFYLFVYCYYNYFIFNILPKKQVHVEILRNWLPFGIIQCWFVLTLFFSFSFSLFIKISLLR